MEELDEWIEISDKDQFADYSSQKITFAQLKQSVASRRFNINYKVLDDMKDELHPMFQGAELEKSKKICRMIFGKNPTIDDLKRDLKPHELNKKCIMSVSLQPTIRKKQKPNFFFKS